MMISQWIHGMAVVVTLYASVSLANASVSGTVRSLEEDVVMYYGNVAWDDLPENVMDAWDNLGFEEISWTVQGLSEEEEDSWSDLDAEDHALAAIIGFTQATWDCHINHYDGYSWADIENANLEEYFVTIGYENETMWEEGADLGFEDEDWDDIHAEVQAALEEICWTKDLWDNYGTVGLLYYGTFDWWDLEKNVRKAWKAIGFTKPKKSWEEQGRDYDAIESKSWYTLILESVSFEENARIVGFTEDTWDCHINHYDDYSWVELGQDDLTEYVVIIGYENEEMWENGADIDVDHEDWDDIDADVQDALEAICWTQDRWDNYF